MASVKTEQTIDCRVSLLTPVGRGAIATIAADGRQAISLVERFFQPLRHRSLSAVSARSILVGHWCNESGGSEEVVVARFDETHVEIHCHGGDAASDAILTTLTNAGALRRESAEWLEEQIPNLIARTAWLALPSARTERAAAILLDQWRGALAAALREILEHLRADPVSFEQAEQRVARLLQLSDVGLHLTQPWQVVLAGPPNVGKSSLVNALLGYERCIVFNEPGTTRDVLTATTALNGWGVELSDTAGYRESTDVVEQEGTRRAVGQVQLADLAVIIADASQPGDADLLPFQQAASAVILVANKVDRCSSLAVIGTGWLPTSAVNGAGIADLARAIVHKLVPSPPQPGEAVPFTADQRDLLRVAQRGIATRDRLTAESALMQILRNDS